MPHSYGIHAYTDFVNDALFGKHGYCDIKSWACSIKTLLKMVEWINEDHRAGNDYRYCAWRINRKLRKRERKGKL